MDCNVNDCGQPRHGKGLCYKHYSLHYKQDRRTNEETAVRDDAFIDALELAELAYNVGEIPCQNAPDLYFPDRDVMDKHSFLQGDSTQNYTMLKDMCNTICPIRNQCLAYALKHNETHGIWGGMSYTERKALKRSLKQTVYKAA
jgi:hypothetical protein